MSVLRRHFSFLTACVAILALYLHHVDGVGVLSTDEPRYAAIGRAMAATGDYITPHLWGSPWYEKPPFVYWMTAAGTLAGLNPDMAGRLPVVLLSLAFLGLFFYLLQREFGAEAAAYATALLATCAAWLAYSSLCLTDVPVAIFFSLAVLLVLPYVDGERTPSVLRMVLIGACFGLAVLAKAFLPIALALPFAWFLRHCWRRWWIAVAVGLAIAAPWFVLVIARNGYAFIDVFFLRQQVSRLYSTELQHVQPWYYYVPALAGSLFPWTPLFGLLIAKQAFCDQRRKFLATIVAFGIVFLSISLNKLPGYLIPLLPAAFALLAARFEQRPFADIPRLWFVSCAALTALIPLVALLLPAILTTGANRLPLPEHLSLTALFYCIAPIGVALLARRNWRPTLLVLCVVAAGIYLKDTAFPLLDQQVSARGLWRDLGARNKLVCDDGLHRAWQYGMQFYLNRPLAPCSQKPLPFGLRQRGNERPMVVQR